MKISELPEFRARDTLLTTTSDVTVLDAVKQMGDRNYGAIVVTDAKGKLEGIFTERDLLRKIVAKGVDPAKMKLKDAMTAKVQTALMDDEVLDCMRRMSNGRFRHLPLIDEEGALQGMVSQGDFVAYTWPQLFSRATENAKALVGGGYWQVLMILGAVLIYTLIIRAFI